MTRHGRRGRGAITISDRSAETVQIGEAMEQRQRSIQYTSFRFVRAKSLPNHFFGGYGSLCWKRSDTHTSDLIVDHCAPSRSSEIKLYSLAKTVDAATPRNPKKGAIAGH